MSHTVNISLEDAYRGTVRRVRVSDDEQCTRCKTPCPDCKGAGMQTSHVRMGPMVQMVTGPCGRCGARGSVVTRADAKCGTCKGSGRTVEQHVVEINVPRGLSSGAQMRMPVSGRLDLLVTVAVAPHPNFIRRGENLTMEVPLTLREAFLGKKFVVPHFDGVIAIDTATRGVVYDGQTEVFRGRGMPDIARPSERGDLTVLYQVVRTPQRPLTEAERALFAAAFDELMRPAEPPKPLEPLEAPKQAGASSPPSPAA
jgi:molecular chaperone DnaJ